MQFRSVHDLFCTVRTNTYRIPKDVDLVVGVPRSGMLAATAVSLAIHKPLTDLHSFLNGRMYSGLSYRGAVDSALEPKSVLIVDDSIYGGRAMQQVKGLIESHHVSAKVTFAAIYGLRKDHDEVDFIFEVCPAPRVFEWNVLNHWVLEYACVDLDGVLCNDPTNEQNDDGTKYLEFLANAEVLNAPQYRIHSIVTSRLERYRAQTERWLHANGISYSRLAMLDVATAEERRRRGLHASFKAAVYKEANDCILFIESETHQAEEINALTGKSTLAFRDMIFFGENFRQRSVRAARRRIGRLLPAPIRRFVKALIP